MMHRSSTKTSIERPASLPMASSGVIATCRHPSAQGGQQIGAALVARWFADEVIDEGITIKST
jgi:hypothetical protein